MSETTLDISVIICAYTEERWDDLVAAVESVRQQTLPAAEIIIVIDHNPQLLERAQDHMTDVIVVENTEACGLRGARNSGLAVARSQIIAFLDDDAVAVPDWLMFLTEGYTDPNVLGTGGAVTPFWVANKPSWLPEEFYWVVGCTYRGMPQTVTTIRNPIGANMSFRRQVFDTVGDFHSEIERVGPRHAGGCEETELCIRTRQHWPQSTFLYQPKAKVFHCVPDNRTRWRYFCGRCYVEGLAKAVLARYLGAKDSLAGERVYTLRTLPQGIMRGLADALFHRDLSGFARAGAIVVGLMVTMAGYLIGSIALQKATLRNTATTFVPSLQEYTTMTDSATDFAPVLIQEIELGQPLPTLSAFDKQRERSYQRARCLVRLHTQPLGLVDFTFDTGELSPDEYAQHIWQVLGEQINAHLRADGLPEVMGLDAAGLPGLHTPRCLEEREAFLQRAPFASVVISTRDRPDRLARCLRTLLALQYPGYEVIVVDNAPSTSATADLIQQRYADEPKIRYVREDHPGLSAGRNRGIMEARGDIIAFTDDDVVVDTCWLAGLARGFEVAENVACVTSLILPLELETPAQFLFEAYGGFTRGFSRRIFDLREHRWKKPAYPYIVGACGTGASMAFTATFLQEEGGFDPALSSLAEDNAAFFCAIIHGYRLVYEPASLVYHQHRRGYPDLQKQLYAYGVGFTAYLTKIIIDHPLLIFDCLNKFACSMLFLWRYRSPRPEEKKETVHYPQELKRLERKGRLRGPLTYVRRRLSEGWTRQGLALARARANAARTTKGGSSDQSQESLVESMEK